MNIVELLTALKDSRISAPLLDVLRTGAIDIFGCSYQSRMIEDIEERYRNAAEALGESSVNLLAQRYSMARITEIARLVRLQWLDANTHAIEEWRSDTTSRVFFTRALVNRHERRKRKKARPNF